MNVRPPRCTSLPYPTLSRFLRPWPPHGKDGLHRQTVPEHRMVPNLIDLPPLKAQPRRGFEADHLAPNDRLGPSISLDRKSTRLNSSHANISYAVFCLK